MRVLVAEDERITRRSLQRQLESWGHDVLAAADGLEASQLYESEPVDLVISDWDMPKVTGIELVRRIRAFKDRPFVYIMMLTGRDETNDIVEGLGAGADDYLRKPFEKTELRARMLAGERVVRIERALSQHVEQLRASQARMARDLEAAAELQQAMLPPADLSHPAVNLAWRYIPCDELGGDALGFEIIDDRFLVAYLLDVSGHGVPASLLAFSASQALTARGGLAVDGAADALETSMGPMTPPASVAAQLNDRFRFDQIGRRFFTMLYSVVDLATGRMEFVSAGHHPPRLYRSGKSLDLGDTHGPPIAVLPGDPFGSTAVQLEPGDRVYMYSDGLVEQAREDEQFGEARIDAALREAPAGSVQTSVDHLVSRLQAWATGSLDDDASVAGFCWRPGVAESGPRE